MPKNNETRKSQRIDLFFEDNAHKSLRSYFGNVVKGQPEVYDTPFAKGESTEDLLSAWNEVLKSINDKWPSLYAFELDLREKVGPLSIMKPLAERMSDIESYYQGILLPSTPIAPKAIEEVKREFGVMRGLRLREQYNTMLRMKKSTNSGSPYFTKRRLVASKSEPVDVFCNGREVYQQFFKRSARVWNSCAVLGWRGQEGGYSKEDVKQRVVWMFPFGVNIAELQAYQVLIESCQRFNVVPAWVSMDAVDQRITEMFDSKPANDLIVCTDFSKFDQHFNKDLQNAALSILQFLFTRQSIYNWSREVFPAKYVIPLMYNYDRIRFGEHGMGSGSGGTNADETLAHRALQHEAAWKAGAYLNPGSQCLGDDGVLTYPGITVDDVVDCYTKHGLEMNPDKQYASTQDCVYLRRWHHINYRVDEICVGVYSTFRALGRMRYLERFMNPDVWDEEAVELRYLSILENVKWHPLREQFVKFCMKRDKFRLGIDLPNFLGDIVNIARKKIDLMPDFLGYTKTMQLGKDPIGGIESWWIVNYLKSLK